jgi:hypothetical protein
MKQAAPRLRSCMVSGVCCLTRLKSAFCSAGPAEQARVEESHSACKTPVEQKVARNRQVEGGFDLV